MTSVRSPKLRLLLLPLVAPNLDARVCRDKRLRNPSCVLLTPRCAQKNRRRKSHQVRARIPSALTYPPAGSLNGGTNHTACLCCEPHSTRVCDELEQARPASSKPSRSTPARLSLRITRAIDFTIPAVCDGVVVAELDTQKAFDVRQCRMKRIDCVVYGLLKKHPQRGDDACQKMGRGES